MGIASVVEIPFELFLGIRERRENWLEINTWWNNHRFTDQCSSLAFVKLFAVVLQAPPSDVSSNLPPYKTLTQDASTEPGL
jgi:hypothetical protein